MTNITIRHVGGNTLSGTVEQVLSTHLAPGWSLVQHGTTRYVRGQDLPEGPYGYGSRDR